MIGINYNFKIEDKEIITYFNREEIERDSILSGMKNSEAKSKLIRYFGWHYPSSTTPWWKFWEWKIFH